MAVPCPGALLMVKPCGQELGPLGQRREPVPLPLPRYEADAVVAHGRLDVTRVDLHVDGDAGGRCVGQRVAQALAEHDEQVVADAAGQQVVRIVDVDLHHGFVDRHGADERGQGQLERAAGVRPGAQLGDDVPGGVERLQDRLLEAAEPGVRRGGVLREFVELELAQGETGGAADPVVDLARHAVPALLRGVTHDVEQEEVVSAGPFLEAPRDRGLQNGRHLHQVMLGAGPVREDPSQELHGDLEEHGSCADRVDRRNSL